MMDSETIAAKLAEIVGATHVSSAPADVDAYGGLEPFLVVWPGAAPEVARLLKTCQTLGVAVGVAGCGTRTYRHWPLQDDRPRIALDTERMMNILEVDELSQTVHCQCGIKVRYLEEALQRQKLTLGPFPESIHHSTIGGLLAAPSHRGHSPKVGWMSGGCIALSVAHADGSMIHSRVVPRRAAGPDLAKLYIGSRGALGVITTAVMRVHRLPEQLETTGYQTPDLQTAIEAGRRMLVHGLRPARLRALGTLQAVEELGPHELSGGPDNDPAALLMVLSGPAAMVVQEQRLIHDILTQLGGSRLSTGIAEGWWARHSEPRETVSREPVGSRQYYSNIQESLEAAPRKVGRGKVHVWAEEFTLRGATLWFSRPGVKQASRRLRAAVIDAGMDPLRLNFPPLMEELRQKLDPDQTLVVMEA